MLSGKTFLICGLSRLTVRVAAAVAADNARVIVLPNDSAPGRYASLLPPQAQVLDDSSLAEVLSAHPGLECVLALDDNDLDNLKVAALLGKLSPDTPVVVRAFDPALADQLEQGLGIRRAYSVSALSAPAFVTAALGHRIVETLRLGEREVLILEVSIATASACAGLSPVEVKRKHRCAVLARRFGESWHVVGAAGDGPPIAEGERLVIGGLLDDALRVARDNSPVLSRERPAKPPRFAPPARHRSRSFSLLPQTATALVAFLLIAIFVFAHAMNLRPVDAIYFVITTATTTGYGDISLRDSPDWLKMFGALVMLSGGALLGILFSQLAAATTANRIDEVNGWRAQRLRGHIIVAGIGNLGYRVARLLTELEIPAVVIERDRSGQFVESVRERLPVVIGDARLTDDLARVGVAECAAAIACTDDDLTNIQMCLHARRIAPHAATVARVFDDVLAEQLSGALAIDSAISASATASSAFVGAATDDRAFRHIVIGDAPYLAFRYVAEAPVPSASVEAWRERGIRVLASRQNGSVGPPTAAMPDLAAGDELILCGPRQAVLELLVQKQDESAAAVAS